MLVIFVRLSIRILIGLLIWLAWHTWKSNKTVVASVPATI